MNYLVPFLLSLRWLLTSLQACTCGVDFQGTINTLYKNLVIMALK